MRFFLLSALFATVSVSAHALSRDDIPRIGFTTECPFDALGRRNERLWRSTDTCIRFLEVRRDDVALDTSDAQLLFDEENVYVSMIGRFRSGLERGRPDLSIWNSNHFEVRLRPGGDGAACLQIDVDEFGRIAVARNENEIDASGIRAWAERGIGYWRAAIMIPFAVLGCVAPTSDTVFKVGLFRHNINVPEETTFNGKRFSASSYTPNRYKYDISDEWADMRLTRRRFEPRQMPGPARGRRINLMPDPDFTVSKGAWSAYGRTERQETAPMSGIWTYQAKGKDYQILQGRGIGVRPNTKHTLVVRARAFGAGSALRIVPMVRKHGGVLSESPYVTKLLPLGTEFHDYYLPFVTSGDEQASLVFYKVDNGADDTGVDIAGVRLFEGEIASFEIRRLSRPGRMACEAGSEIPFRPNAYGRPRRPLRILALCSGKPAMREVFEAVSGLAETLDVLVTTGLDQDIYETDSNPAAVTAALEKGDYDVYMVPAEGASRVGKELAGKIMANVRKGAGIYFERNGSLGCFSGLPEKSGAYGQGRVVRRNLAGGRMGYLPLQTEDERGSSFFPFHTFEYPKVSSGVVAAALGDAVISADARVERTVFVYAGQRHTAVKTVDAEGRTLAWRHEKESVKGVRLGAFSDDGMTSRVKLIDTAEGDVLRWSLADFSGRILAEGTRPGADEVAFVVPRDRLYTNYGGIRLEIVSGGGVRDRRGEAIFVAENDRKRLFDDFTPSMWPIGNDAPDVSFPELHRRLSEIGLRASLFPSGGSEAYAFMLRTGFGVGGTWIGGSARFWAPAQKSNVRSGQFNTTDARRRISERAGRIAAETAKYGLVHHSICDEPCLTRTGTSDEVDAHPENLAVYRKRMKGKYGTIENYNRRHQTAHRSFADLDQALLAETRAARNPAEFIEWRNFNVDRWAEAIRLVADAVHKEDARTPLSLGNTFGQSALSGNDYWKLLEKTGIGFSHEYTAMVYFSRRAICNFDEFFRSFRPDIRLWGWTGYFYTAERARFMPWWFAAHRYGGFSWYAAAIWGYGNLVDLPTYAYTREGRELKTSLDDSRLLKGLGKVLTCWSWAPRDIALYYSHDSMLLSTWLGKETKNMEVRSSGPLRDFLYSRQGAQYLVEDLLYQHDFVSPEQVAKGRLDSCKVLFMPRIIAMSDAEVSSVRAFAENGGKIICDVLPGEYDELGVRRGRNPFSGCRGIVTTGRTFDDADPVHRRRVLTELRSAGSVPVLESHGIVERAGREAMRYVSSGADVYVVLRMPGRSSDRMTDTMRFAGKGHLYDVRKSRYLGFSDTVTTEIGRADAAVFAVLPSKIESISVRGLPEICRRGTCLDVELGTVAPGHGTAKVPSYVLHVELTPPSGTAPFHFSRNLLTEDGRVRFRFALAHNDPTGRWRLSVREPLTGVAAEKNFVLE